MTGSRDTPESLGASTSHFTTVAVQAPRWQGLPYSDIRHGGVGRWKWSATWLMAVVPLAFLLGETPSRGDAV